MAGCVQHAPRSGSSGQQCGQAQRISLTSCPERQLPGPEPTMVQTNLMPSALTSHCTADPMTSHDPADTWLGVCSTPPGQACQASDPDGIVARALVAGLASVQDSDLPLLCSNFWSRNVLQGRPAGVDPDT